MRLHNKLEIVYNGESKVFYNNLVLNVYNSIKSLLAYNNCIAVGSGTASTESTDTTLGFTLGVFESEIEDYNFNPKNGNIFVSKSVNLNGKLDSDVSISEVGIAVDNSSTPNIVNRFLLTDSDGVPLPIEYKSGKDLIIIITLYLSFDEANSNVCLFDVESPFLARLLGIDIVEDGVDAGFTASKCNICTPTEGVLAPFQILSDQVPATLTAEVVEDKLNLKIVADFSGEIVYGVAIRYAGVLCLYQNCYDTATLVDAQLSATTDRNMTITLTEPRIACIESVYDVETGSSPALMIVDFDRYATRAGEFIERPFGDFEYNNCEQIFTCNNGKLVMFLQDGRLDGYKVNGVAFVKIDTSEIPVSNIKDVKMVDKSLFIRYYYPETNTYDLKYFIFDGTGYRLGTITLKEPTDFAWIDWDVAQTNTKNGYGLIYVCDTCTRLLWLLDDLETKTATEHAKRVIDMVFVRVKALHGCNISEATFYGITESNGSYTTYYIDASSETAQPGKAVIQYMLITRASGCTTPLSVPGFVMAVDNSKKYFTSVRLYMSSVPDNRNANYNQGENVYYANVSTTGKYVARVSTGNILSLYYYEFDKTSIHPFENTYDLGEDGTIKNIIILNGIALLFFANSDKKVLALPLIEENFTAGPITVGHPAIANVKIAKLPGVDESYQNGMNMVLTASVSL